MPASNKGVLRAASTVMSYDHFIYMYIPTPGCESLSVCCFYSQTFLLHAVDTTVRACCPHELSFFFFSLFFWFGHDRVPDVFHRIIRGVYGLSVTLLGSLMSFSHCRLGHALGTCHLMSPLSQPTTWSSNNVRKSRKKPGPSVAPKGCSFPGLMMPTNDMTDRSDKSPSPFSSPPLLRPHRQHHSRVFTT